MTPVLPAEFADLEPFADWSLRTEAERYAKRLSSTMGDLQSFYDAAFPRFEAMTAYLDALDLAALPEECTRLLWLCYSLVNVSFPVEVWRQPRVPDSGAASIAWSSRFNAPTYCFCRHMMTAVLFSEGA
jgi:hypothetical protein